MICPSHTAQESQSLSTKHNNFQTAEPFFPPQIKHFKNPSLQHKRGCSSLRGVRDADPHPLGLFFPTTPSPGQSLRPLYKRYKDGLSKETETSDGTESDGKGGSTAGRGRMGGQQSQVKERLARVGTGVGPGWEESLGAAPLGHAGLQRKVCLAQ